MIPPMTSPIPIMLPTTPPANPPANNPPRPYMKATDATGKSVVVARTLNHDELKRLEEAVDSKTA